MTCHISTPWVIEIVHKNITSYLLSNIVTSVTWARSCTTMSLWGNSTHNFNTPCNVFEGKRLFNERVERKGFSELSSTGAILSHVGLLDLVVCVCVLSVHVGKVGQCKLCTQNSPRWYRNHNTCDPLMCSYSLALGTHKVLQNKWQGSSLHCIDQTLFYVVSDVGAVAVGTPERPGNARWDGTVRTSKEIRYGNESVGIWALDCWIATVNKQRNNPCLHTGPLWTITMISGELRMAQVFLSFRIWCQVVADNFNSKYIVAMAMSHPAANMAHTWDVLNYISRNAESKEMIELHTNVRISLWSGLPYSKGIQVPLLRMRQWVKDDY